MIHLAGFTCCLGGVALYLLSRSTGRVVKSITRVHHIKDLEELVEVESKVLPSLVIVSGSVGSETPIKCDHSDLLGVFVKKTAEEQVLRRNWMFSWVPVSTFMQPVTKEVPWYLDDGTGRVNVAVSQGEIGLPLTVGSDVFEMSEPVSFVQRTLDYLKGLQILGVRSIERIVPIGKPLTVVGEAVKDGMGNVRIRKPEQGPFYVSCMPLEQVISKLGEPSRRFKYASMGLTVLGVILLTKPVIEYILKRMENFRERRRQLSTNRDVDTAPRRAEPVTRVLIRQHENSSGGTSRTDRFVDAAATTAEPVTRGLIRQHENSSGGTSRDGDTSDLCVICLDRKYNAAFVRCGHMCCCMTCSSQLTTCPLCRGSIEQVLRIYRH